MARNLLMTLLLTQNTRFLVFFRSSEHRASDAQSSLYHFVWTAVVAYIKKRFGEVFKGYDNNNQIQNNK